MNQDVSEDSPACRQTGPAARRRTPCIALRRFSSPYGQSMLEMAIFLPVLLLLIAGMVEVGMYANDYLTLLDAAREAARFGSNLDPEFTVQYPFDAREGAAAPFPDVRPTELITPSVGMTPEDLDNLCKDGDTTNFYYEVACLAFQNIPLGQLRPGQGDDVVVTVVGFVEQTIAYRWPLADHANPADWPYHFQGADDGDTNPTCTITNTENCRCWSLYGVRGSQFDNAQIQSLLRTDAPASSLMIVEVFYGHPHFIGFFTIGDFIPDPIQTRPYAIFPVPAAEPTPTPRP